MKLARVFVWGLAIVGLMIPAITPAATEIEYWDLVRPGDGSPRGTALGKNLERFHAKYPDIRVKAVTLPTPMINANLIQGATVGSTPDVSQVLGKSLEMIIAAGALQPLDDFAKSIEYKKDWLMPWTSNQTFIGGKKWALPYGYRADFLLYRKDILGRLGLPVPTTYDEVCTVGGKISSPQVMGYGFGATPADDANILTELHEDVTILAGSELFDEKGRAIFNNAAGLKFFQLVADLVGRCKASGRQVVEIGSNALDEGLKAGTIAMGHQGSHRFSTIRAGGAGENLQWAPPPSFEKGKPAPITVTGFTVAMGKYAKHPQEGWKLIEFLTSPEAQVPLAGASEAPSRKSTYQDPWFGTPEAKNMVGWSEYMEKHGRFGRYPRTYHDFTQILSAEIQSIVLKGVAPADALRNVVERYNKVVEQGK